jgi:hypothetical protein
MYKFIRNLSAIYLRLGCILVQPFSKRLLRDAIYNRLIRIKISLV